MIAKFATKQKTPKYRERAPYGQAIVTLTDAVTRQRKDYWLGEMDSPASREMYHRLIAEWEASGRRLPPPTDVPKPAIHQLSVSEIILKYKQFVDVSYKPATRATIYMSLRVLRQFFGTTSATEFGPNRLRLVRDQMIKGDPGCDPPRKPWARETVNKAVHQIRAMFKWASSHEMLLPDVYYQLRTVAALRRGRSEARETERVEPVAIEIVEATKPFLSRQVRALVDLQLLTGARGGELFRLRATDLEMDSKKGVWLLRPREHKTAHHDHERVIPFGPKAQAVLRPYLIGRPVNAYLFSPAEADAELREARAGKRRTPLHRGNSAGTNRSADPDRKPGEHYNAASYRRAIERACDKAFPLPTHLRRKLSPKSQRETREQYLARLTDIQKAEIRAWRNDHRWHPHQLRHTAGTLIRKEFGLEAARIILGHSSGLVTDAVYAQRDMDRVVEVMRKIG